MILQLIEGEVRVAGCPRLMGVIAMVILTPWPHPAGYYGIHTFSRG